MNEKVYVVTNEGLNHDSSYYEVLAVRRNKKDAENKKNITSEINRNNIISILSDKFRMSKNQIKEFHNLVTDLGLIPYIPEEESDIEELLKAL